MAIDPSIALQVKPVQLESSANALATLLQLQGAKQQNQMGQMKLDEYQAGKQRTNELRQLLGSFTPDMNSDSQVSALTKGGYLPEARSLAESSSKVAKEKRESEKSQLEAVREKFNLAGQIMNGVKDQATWERARAETERVFGPEAAAQMPLQYDPALIAQKQAQAMTVKDQVEQIWKSKGYDLDVRKQGETERNNRAQNSVSQGNLGVAQANLGLSRERLALERQAPKGQYDTERGMLIDPRTGTARPVTGPDGKPIGTGGKPLTEFQGKSAAFGERAIKADEVLNQVGKDFSPTKINAKNAAGSLPLIGGVSESAANSMLTEKEQQVDQAQRDFINAVLRQESGAAIGASEFENAKRQYFPQPNDKPAVLKQKAENRKTAINGFVRSAGPSAKLGEKVTTVANPVAETPSDIADLMKKYGGK